MLKAHDDRPGLARTLAALMDRLCAPDLTLAEARDLRSQLGRLLPAAEAVGERAGNPLVAPAVRPWLGGWCGGLVESSPVG